MSWSVFECGRRLVPWALVAVVAGVPAAATGQPVAAPGSSWNVDFGALRVSPSLVMSSGTDSNVLRADTVAAVSSYEFFTIPQLDLSYQLKHYKLTATTAFEYAYTPSERSDKKSATNNFNEVSFSSPGTVLRPHVSFYRLSTYARSEVELGKRSQRNNSTLDAGLDWAVGRLVFKGGFTSIRTRFEADEFFRDVSLAEKLNFDFSFPSAEVTYALTPLLGLSGRVETGRYEFLLDPTRNGSGLKVTGGATIQPRLGLFAGMVAGYRQFDSDTQGDVRLSGLTAQGTLVYERERSRLVSTYYRDFGFSWDADRALYTINQVTVGVYRPLPRRLEAEFFSDMQWIDYIRRAIIVPGAPTGQKRISALGAMGFRLRPWMRVGVNLEREVSSGAENWDAWRMTTYLYYGSQRFRKLDRPLPR